MSKLIPISSNQMKKMGIVKSKNGYLMREHTASTKTSTNTSNKKERKNEKPKEAGQKNRETKSKVDNVSRGTSNVSRASVPHSPESISRSSVPREVVIVQKNAKQVEKQRMEDRGIY